jgi:hypothetical protein
MKKNDVYIYIYVYKVVEKLWEQHGFHSFSSKRKNKKFWFWDVGKV